MPLTTQSGHRYYFSDPNSFDDEYIQLKNKQLRKWALGAEIISAVAIVVTLAFLTFEMRDNTAAIQAQTYQQLQSELNAYRALYADSEVMKAFSEAQNELHSGGFQNLSENAYWVLFNGSTILWGIYESAYFANERGVLGTREWSRFEKAICRRLERDGPMWSKPGHDLPTSEMLTQDFANYVELTCK